MVYLLKTERIRKHVEDTEYKAQNTRHTETSVKH